MNPKIRKQKQIFSLLNNKFANLLDEVQVDVTEATPGIPVQTGRAGNLKLLERIYNFYKSIIQNINGGLITLDLSGDVTFANQFAANMTGYPLDVLMKMHISDILGDDPAAQKLLRILFIPGRKVDGVEMPVKCPDGQEKIVGLSSSPIHDENNKFDGVVLLMRDVTETYHLKMQVERMERLALLGELSAGIAHEIRNPLAGIKATAQILEESFGVDDFRNQMVERIIREVDKANRLLKEFFKFARPTKPKYGFHDVEMIVDGVYLLLAPKLQKRNIQFDPQFETEVPQVYVDDTQIEQVVLNLFLNAADAMPGGGKISIKTQIKNLRLLADEKDKLKVQDDLLSYVIVEIIDTGEGINKTNLEKIFNPFFTTKNEGVGLGLSISSRLVEENGGKIDVISEPGKGTTFVLALPAFIHK